MDSDNGTRRMNYSSTRPDNRRGSLTGNLTISVKSKRRKVTSHIRRLSTINESEIYSPNSRVNKDDKKTDGKKRKAAGNNIKEGFNKLM